MNIVHDDHIDSVFRRELTKNAAAQAVYESLGPEDLAKLRERLRRAEGAAAIGEIVDSLAGWKIGHAPYQL